MSRSRRKSKKSTQIPGCGFGCPVCDPNETFRHYLRKHARETKRDIQDQIIDTKRIDCG